MVIVLKNNLGREKHPDKHVLTDSFPKKGI